MPGITIDLDDSGQSPEDLAAEVQSLSEALPPHAPDSFADDLVPIVLFLAIALTYCVKYYFAWRARLEMQQTVRSALERGQALTPEVLEHLGQPGQPRNRDLRRGVVGIGLGIGLAAIGLVVGEPDAVRPMLAVGLVPLLLGLAYLVLWKTGGNGR